MRSREAEERAEPRGERGRTELDQVVVEIPALGHDDVGGDACPRAAPGGGANTPRLPAESAAAAVMSGAAVTRESTVSMPSPTRSEANPSAGTVPNRTA